jgi:hypothetical protein
MPANRPAASQPDLRGSEAKEGESKSPDQTSDSVQTRDLLLLKVYHVLTLGILAVGPIDESYCRHASLPGPQTRSFPQLHSSSHQWLGSSSAKSVLRCFIHHRQSACDVKNGGALGTFWRSSRIRVFPHSQVSQGAVRFRVVQS